MIGPLVVVPCGAAKRIVPGPAGELYIGPYFRACLRYARQRTDPGRILILSAKYGLVGLAERIEPYELRMGTPGCVGWRHVRDQARERGLLHLASVEALGGRAYLAVCCQVWPHAVLPLAGVGGIGQQMQMLKLALEETHEPLRS